MDSVTHHGSQQHLAIVNESIGKPDAHKEDCGECQPLGKGRSNVETEGLHFRCHTSFSMADACLLQHNMPIIELVVIADSSLFQGALQLRTLWKVHSGVSILNGTRA